MNEEKFEVKLTANFIIGISFAVLSGVGVWVLLNINDGTYYDRLTGKKKHL